MYIKIHQFQDSQVVAICDEELIGKKVTEGELEINISERYYKGDKKSIEETKEIMKTAKNLNLVGEDTIKLAIELDLIEEKDILHIGGVEHAQIFSL